MKIAFLIPDTHRPYQDKRAYNLMLEVMADIPPDEIVILGDYADFYSVSSHSKDPRLQALLIEEVEDVREGLTQLDDLYPDSKKVFIEGNHEHRLERYITSNAPALFGVTSTQDILQLRGRPNWRFIPYGPNQAHRVLGSHLVARHEPLGPNAKVTAAKALASIVFGHTHRIEEAGVVGIDIEGRGEGKSHVAFSVGWLGNKYACIDNGQTVFEYVKHHAQWALGFGIVYVDPSTGLFYHQKIPILELGRKLSCVVNGKLYKN